MGTGPVGVGAGIPGRGGAVAIVGVVAPVPCGQASIRLLARRVEEGVKDGRGLGELGRRGVGEPVGQIRQSVQVSLAVGLADGLEGSDGVLEVDDGARVARRGIAQLVADHGQSASQQPSVLAELGDVGPGVHRSLHMGVKRGLGFLEMRPRLTQRPELRTEFVRVKMKNGHRLNLLGATCVKKYLDCYAVVTAPRRPAFASVRIGCVIVEYSRTGGRTTFFRHYVMWR